MGQKKHKRHKNRGENAGDESATGVSGSGVEKTQSLKLILKVGNCVSTASTGDDQMHTDDYGNSTVYGGGDDDDDDDDLEEDNNEYDQNASIAGTVSQYDDGGSVMVAEQNLHSSNSHSHHKKSKKKKKKKEKNRDKDRDREKKHKHKHKSKKRRHREEAVDENAGELVADDDPNPDGTTYANLVSREPRTCVLKRQKEETPLQKLLEHLLKTLEKRDPKQFFAYPVTDAIAPDYSKIISHPMDFSTMRQKIDDNKYATLQEFISDFKLMCSNAMHYNHAETVYYKASKKLLHAGLKLMQPEKLGWILSYVSNLTSDELGFEICSIIQTKTSSLSMQHEQLPASETVIGTDTEPYPKQVLTGANSDPNSIENNVNASDANNCHSMPDTEREKAQKRKRPAMGPMPNSKFEAIPDNLTPEEILEQVQEAAKKRRNAVLAASGATISASGATSGTGTNPNTAGTPMGFLRQRKDGTTSLSILIGGDGTIGGTNQRPVLLGSLIGKLNEGTNQLTGFREDRRNQVKTVKPLYYGAFGSYAPSYDSAFANLSKDESELVLQTYGSENAMQYAESLIDFTRDSDYAMRLADNLLDTLTNGEHSRTREIIEERRKIRDEDESIERLMKQAVRNGDDGTAAVVAAATAEKTVEGAVVATGDVSAAVADGLPPAVTNIDNNANVEISVNDLKSLSDIGIDTSFLKLLDESDASAAEATAAAAADADFLKKLNETSEFLNRLNQVQHERISMPLPNLDQLPGPSSDELEIAESVTAHLTAMAKHVNPGAIAPVAGLRKAMGITMPPPPSPPPPPPPPPLHQQQTQQQHIVDPLMTEFESELREYLENEQQRSLNRDDRSIDEIFLS